MNPNLMTDRYELSMLTTALRTGTVNRRAIFEAFPRRLPGGRGFGMVAGTERLIEMIRDLRFDADTVQWLRGEGVIDDTAAQWLSNFRFTGTITGLREGDVYFPGTPVLTVESTYGEGLILETLILSVLNHDSAVASAAARMVLAADGKPLIEMGSRRTHEASAVAAARAAYIAGFAATSNLAAGRAYGVPTTGTAAHASILSHAGDTRFGDPTGEKAAFIDQMTAHGVGTTILVDTYDTTQGIRKAVAATRLVSPGVNGPGAIRIDSGDLAGEAYKARVLLDDLGAADTKIVITSDVDEFTISDPVMKAAPVDSFGAGTRVVTGSGHPAAGMVYKLVEIEDPDGDWRSVAKAAVGKPSSGGWKDVRRTPDLTREVHFVNVLRDEREPSDLAPAHVSYVVDGRTLNLRGVEAARTHAAETLAALPASVRAIAGQPVIPEVVTRVLVGA